MASISSQGLSVEVKHSGSVVRVDLTILSEPLTDEDVEHCFRSFKEGVQELAKRPRERETSSLSLTIVLLHESLYC